MSAILKLPITGFSRPSMEEYNSAPGARSTFLKKLLRSPAHALVEQEQTAAMELGIQLHTALGEPDKIVESQKFDRRTKEGKAGYEAFAAANQGKVILDPDDFALVKGMADAINAHPAASIELYKGQTELSCFWNENGIDCKARFDFVDLERRVIVDLKTTRDASPGAFARQIANLKYHLSAAHYLSGAFATTGEPFTFRIVAVESQAPFAVAVYEMDILTLEAGEGLRLKALEIYRQCMATKEWPAYSPEIQTIAVPLWALAEGADES